MEKMREFGREIDDQIMRDKEMKRRQKVL